MNKTKASAKDFFSFWNLRKNLPQIRAFTDERKKKLKVRMKEPLFAENWQRIIDRISASRFCTGHNDRGWKADVDWILGNSTYYTRVLEGKYDNNGDGKVEAAPFDEGAAAQRQDMKSRLAGARQ